MEMEALVWRRDTPKKSRFFERFAVLFYIRENSRWRGAQKKFLEQVGFIDNLGDYINHSISQDSN